MGSHHKSFQRKVASHLLQSYRKCTFDLVHEKWKLCFVAHVMEIACTLFWIRPSQSRTLGGHKPNTALMFVTVLSNVSSALLGRDMTKSPRVHMANAFIRRA